MKWKLALLALIVATLLPSTGVEAKKPSPCMALFGEMKAKHYDFDTMVIREHRIGCDNDPWVYGSTDFALAGGYCMKLAYGAAREWQATGKPMLKLTVAWIGRWIDDHNAYWKTHDCTLYEDGAWG